MDIASVKRFCETNGIGYLTDVNLSERTSFRIGGNSELFVLPDTEEKAVKLFSFLAGGKIPYTLFGAGTNLLVSDGGIKGVTVCLEKLSDIISEKDTLKAYAGAKLSTLSKKALSLSLSGLEFAYGIPGSVGGAVCMNAGAYGGSMSDVVTFVTFIEDGKVKTLSKEELGFSYRKSIFSDGKKTVLSASFTLKNGEKTAIEEKMNELIERRKAKQPLEFPSAGSAFKRPENNFAGTLIENCGLKGKSVGGAKVSEKHAGFIINTGNATAKDVKELISLVTNTVYEKTGIKLEREVIYVGDEER